MKIIDNKKDSYDFLMGVLGTDNLVVYDRRGSTVLNANKSIFEENCFFTKEKSDCDTVKRKIYYWNSEKYHKGNRWRFDYANKKDKFIYEGKIYQFILEIGYNQYYFEVERYLDENDNLHVEPTIILSKRVEKDKRLCDSPMSFVPCYHSFGENFRYNKKNIIQNPILKNTYIPGMITNLTIWNNLYEYISSLRDKDIKDNRTDIEHIESNGFDKKISFRHRKNGD